MSELFSAFGIDWRLLIAQTINFVIVFGGLTYFLYKPLMKVVTEREEKVKKGVKDAEAASKAKEEIEGEKDEIIKAAHSEASLVVERATEEGKKERTEIVRQAQERAENAIKDAALQSEELKKRALQESEKEIARVAILAAEKLIREKA